MFGFHTLKLTSLPELPARAGVLYVLQEQGEPRRLGGFVAREAKRPRWMWLSLDSKDKTDELALVLLRLCRRYGIHSLDINESQHPRAALLKRLAALDGWGIEEWSRLG
ncbi:hypothetical protein [Shewanella khirikhana]|uniref:Uncharacterized protein n=1 Tax=Shewanella khirikhana TaxID=1965282 RepID=A0ABM7DT27_9GAMM|nr:hypothetical protein [Shewanella khirikhana]AZQ12866.1 hypothetical protein STH12_03814 [Shewanella khirikhana]